MSESKIWTLKWLDPLILFLLNKLAILGKKQLLVTLDIFGFFPPNYATGIFSQSYQRSSGFDTS